MYASANRIILMQSSVCLCGQRRNRPSSNVWQLTLSASPSWEKGSSWRLLLQAESARKLNENTVQEVKNKIEDEHHHCIPKFIPANNWHCRNIETGDRPLSLQGAKGKAALGEDSLLCLLCLAIAMSCPSKIACKCGKRPSRGSHLKRVLVTMEEWRLASSVLPTSTQLSKNIMNFSFSNCTGFSIRAQCCIFRVRFCMTFAEMGSRVFTLYSCEWCLANSCCLLFLETRSTSDAFVCLLFIVGHFPGNFSQICHTGKSNLKLKKKMHSCAIEIKTSQR